MLSEAPYPIEARLRNHPKVPHPADAAGVDGRPTRQPGVMMIQGLLTASVAAAGIFASAAQAGVVYNGFMLDPGNVGTFTARLEVDAAAYQAGSLTENYQTGCGNQPPNCTTPATTNLIAFFFQRAGGGTFMLDFRQGVNFGGATPIESFALQFLPDGGLAGSISVTDTNYDLALSGSGLWSVGSFATPGAFRCGPGSGNASDPVCTATGRWVLDASTVPADIPEPGVLPLLALGAFGVAASMRRQKSIRSRLRSGRVRVAPCPSPIATKGRVFRRTPTSWLQPR